MGSDSIVTLTHSGQHSSLRLRGSKLQKLKQIKIERRLARHKLTSKELAELSKLTLHL